MTYENLLDIKGLQLSYKGKNFSIQAIRDATLQIRPGESVGLVGESGSGKSTLARCVLGLNSRGLTRIDGGSIFIAGRDVTQARESDWAKLRGSPVAMVFQDPLSFLNPLMRVDAQIAESVRRHDPKANLSQRISELLGLVKLPERARSLYPHEISGGMRQRVLLAIALGCRPKLLVADEPTTALDVTTQKEIMQLLAELRQSLGMSMLLISHDLGLISQSCERIYVMYAGRTIETGASADITKDPKHPYTKGLFDSARALRLPNGRFATIGGEVPNLAHRTEGCPFRVRCGNATEICTTLPDPTYYGPADRHMVKCWNPVNNQALSTEVA